jgi:adenylyltransferase/sulfurtransferase
MARPLEISVQELKAVLDSGMIAAGDATLLDVREPWEAEICRIPGSTLVPLGALAMNASALERRKPIYVYCHHGARSMQATQWLRRNGFAGASNVAGGIHAWAEQIEPGMARY